jgi:hypothetical protein
MVMILTEIKDLVRSQIQSTLDLRLLRGDLPWSLAGSDGGRRNVNLERRDALVTQIDAAIGPLGWSATLEPVTSAAGRTNKLELVLRGPGQLKDVWSW